MFVSMHVCMCVCGWVGVFVHHCTTGWLRLVGSLKLQVSFAEYPLFYRSLLQKRPRIIRSLLIEATPYALTTDYNINVRTCIRVCVSFV